MTKAAKRKKEKEEPNFAIPEFDEGAYMRKEVEGAKAAVICVILAIPVAGVLYGLAVLGLAVVAFFLGIALTFSLPRIFGLLKVLPWPKVNTSTFERRDWLGHGSTFFFSWFAFWILLLNAPFVDLTDPVIGVSAFAGVSTIVMQEGLTRDVGRLPTDAPVLFNVTILENVGLAETTITIQGNEFQLNQTGGARYAFTYLPATSGAVTLSVDVYARDVSGHVARFAFEVQLS